MPKAASRELWDRCLGCLEGELPSEQYNMWIRPLQPWVSTDGRELVLWAPNHFVVDWVKSKYLNQIEAVMMDLQPQVMPTLSVKVGSITTSTDIENKKGRLSPENNVAAIPVEEGSKATPSTSSPTSASIEARSQKHRPLTHRSNLNSQFRFDNFVEGKANRWAAAAAQQVAENPGSPGYNPLLLYGGVGLGKTHLMHAVGNTLLQRRPDAKVVYLHSERFVADMVSALRNKTIDDFQRFYRSVDALLIDDIQFFAGKEQSQEEFFHTFNSLMERGQQIILTCDKFPKEIDGLEDRLKSRFGWGLSQLLEPPELETRVAILKREAEDERITLPDEVAFFIAQRIRSNVRELEGVLKRVIAHIRFTSNPEISVGLVKDALKDVLAIQARMVSIDNIQRMVSDYFKIKIVDLLSKKRTRSIARPRQIAMALSRELTTQSLPEIADAFGGLDHTTVLHACRKVADLRAESPEFEQDYQNLLRSLTS